MAQRSTRLALLAVVVTLMVGSGAAAAGSAPEPAKGEAPLATATFAGGCFWCMEPAFDGVPGVVSTTSGYTGGAKRDPSYEEVSAGDTGHVEAVQVLYDPSQVSYARLLEVFWHNVDPLDDTGQFCDKGEQYRSAIFSQDEEQRRLAEESKLALQNSGRFKQPLATLIVPASDFYPAEEYHQDYYRKNPLRYRFYRSTCGRDSRLKAVWGEDAKK
jgi:peptide-methionine (S)-S-oxide reductase